jgi:hypothetical protein
MKLTSIIILLLIALCAAMYFIGRINGREEVKATIINNTQLMKQIAELSSLEVTGSTTAKITNSGNETGIWSSLKNYFAENTLQVTIPYITKYGVDISKSAFTVNYTDSSLIINLPPCKMLSLQLQLDKVETMNQTGLFARTTIADMKMAEQQLYNAASQELSSNGAMLEKAKQHIIEIYNQYYSAFGYRVVCNFTQP